MDSRNTKIGEHNPMVCNLGRICQENVLRFEVAMDDTFLMKVAKSTNHLANNDSCVKLFGCPMAKQEGHEIAPGGKFREGIAIFMRSVMPR